MVSDRSNIEAPDDQTDTIIYGFTFNSSSQTDQKIIFGKYIALLATLSGEFTNIR